MAVKKSRVRAMLQSPDPLSGAPWWVRAGALFGLPALAAGVLLYWMRTDINAKLDTLMAQQSTIAKQVETNAALFQVAQRICINTSKTDQQRMDCVTIHADKTP